MNIIKRKTAVALLSVLSNTVLVLLKLIVGVVIGSVSVISEAIHSGVDLIAAIIALYAVRTSGRPADKEHPFGHGKVENISGTVEAILIFVAAIWIIYEAAKKLMNPQAVDSAAWGIGVMLLSAVANIIVSQMLFKVGKETDSIALQADGWHLRTDVYTSAGVMLGLALMWAGEKILVGVHLHWIDPVAAMVVAVLIIKAAYKLTVESSRDLLDASLPHDEISWIRDHLSSLHPTIRAFHGLRTRKAGSHRFIEFHMLVSPSMSVEESHRITDVTSGQITNQYSGATVTIHVEPCDGSCSPECLEGCLLSEQSRLELVGQI